MSNCKKNVCLQFDGWYRYFDNYTENNCLIDSCQIGQTVTISVLIDSKFSLVF